MVMEYKKKIITDIEIHSIEGIKECFAHGVGANDIYHDLPLIYELISEYQRGDSFKACVQVFVDHGLKMDDQALVAVLLDDATQLKIELNKNQALISKRYYLKSAFTPLQGVSLLHICAEHNHIQCAQILLSSGANVNALADVDRNGLGGHTPIFHTVNQRQNFTIDMLKLLIDHGADLHHQVNGLIWGQGYEWETFIPAVNPISYAMMGLLRQFQRNERDVYDVVTLLMKKCYNIQYYPTNIPNKYLQE